jgi:hypothetical protein
MKYLAITILFSSSLVFCIPSQAEDYCYSWDCDSNESSNKGIGSNNYGIYGDKGKESKYADKLGTKKKTPSSCDTRKKSTAKKGDPAQKNYTPCVKLY